MKLMEKFLNPNRKQWKKIEKLINKKLLKLNEQNKEENQKIELNYLALQGILTKSYKDDECFDRKNLLIQQKY